MWILFAGGTMIGYNQNFHFLSFLSFFIFYLLWQTCVPAILPPLKDIYPGNLVDDLKGTFRLYVLI